MQKSLLGIISFSFSNKYFGRLSALQNYRINNHLGNVLATITDKKLPVDDSQNGLSDYYLADVSNLYDYYPFGMLNYDRKYSSTFVCLGDTVPVGLDTVHFDNTTSTALWSSIQDATLSIQNNMLNIAYNTGNLNFWGAETSIYLEAGIEYTFEIDFNHGSCDSSSLLQLAIFHNGIFLTGYNPPISGTFDFQFTPTVSDDYDFWNMLRWPGDSCDFNINYLLVTKVDSFNVVKECGDSGRGYRYGFNSMERDDEIKGSGNSYDFGARIYDPRLGRWMSVDPLFKKFPEQSPYNFGFNNPIFWIDSDGKEPVKKHAGTVDQLIRLFRENDVKNITQAAQFFGANQGPKSVSGEQGTNQVARYIYTSKGGWIDMRHFFAAAKLTESNIPKRMVLKAGEIVERRQEKNESSSAWAYEDLPSNLQGAEFGVSARRITEIEPSLEGEEFYSALENLFKDLGATDPSVAPNWNEMPESSDRPYGEVPQNRTYEPMYTIEDPVLKEPLPGQQEPKP